MVQTAKKKKKCFKLFIDRQAIIICCQLYVQKTLSRAPDVAMILCLDWVPVLGPCCFNVQTNS
jgi:hypothetical protein